ncbi:MAG: lipoprotein-releasing system ATP-binding protein LolD [Halieaceae bacterium MED-G27]|jgi:lipoprotein-releasing system ATP-binding protein|nr:lipoprotein-releasing system ATP-binding protein LolD [Halieaceae bacterium]OUT66507.1 MAG: lipoprotein-releasing system ATP-binding protein LolD [Cellvibrionales bacterium TMED21]PDH38405.1 MAG: lipoprotein-releasing system ATP-binding protein LolD [Halieaceae bacterium MED-G27]|tara:strand:- start:1715 stop:2389 length:675 start_codon:yes stop_codon:yes gene_type:complete
MKTILEAVSLHRSYASSGGSIDVLKGVDLVLSAGERVAIVGTSGAGKSTLLNLMGGLDQPTSGSVLVAGKDLHSLDEQAQALWRNRHLGFVFQFHHLMPEFSALEAVAMPARIGGQSKQQAQESARELLVSLGLEARLSHRPSMLSGGERQRVAIARALVNKPVCVLMDEPTGNLDPETADSVIQLIESLSNSDSAFVLVTHDQSIAARMDTQYRLIDGRLALS